jgi:hypothetical protein
VRRLAGIVVALVELLAAGAFDVNGGNYDWWSRALFVLAAFTLVLTAVPDLARRFAVRLPVVALAAAVAVGAVAVTTRHFNDSYHGSRAWPSALACLFAAAVGVTELAAVRRYFTT